MEVTVQDIEAAATRIKSRVIVSPCPASIPLSEMTGAKIFCKLEYLQRTGSFKERGAANAILQLTDAQKKAGVIAASAGNHALGLSYQGKLSNVPVVVVMPEIAPLTKIANCRRLGAEVILHGHNLAEAYTHAHSIATERQLTYINGYDMPAVIAGQGTMGLEILEQVPDLEALVVPIGGGGLIAGLALAIKTRKPTVQIFGVQAKRAAGFATALKTGKPVPVAVKPTLADGLAVSQVGANAFEIARRFVDRVVTVDEHEIALAVLRLLELEKAVVEGAGAAPLAACLAGLCPELAGRKVVFPLTGGNIDMNILGRVLERGLASDGRLCRFTANISDRPGGLAFFAKVIAEEGASIMEIEHDRAFASDDINIVTVYCTVETRDAAHVAALEQRLKNEGFEVAIAQRSGGAGVNR